MKSIDQAKLYSLTGLELTMTFGTNGAGKAWLFANGRIVIDITTDAAIGDITLTTPTDFRVLNGHSLHKNGTTSTWTVKNNTTAVFDTVTATSIKDIDTPTTVDTAQYDFLEGDDDLKITIATAAFLGTIILDIQFINP